MQRRAFLLSGAAAAAATTLGCSRETATTPAMGVALARGQVAWSKAPCRFCGTGCGVEVGVAEGKVVAVRGDELSPVNKGLLCVKGYHLPALLYGRDRLLRPLLRNADGRGFQPVSWDQALDLVAAKFQDALAQHGPQAVAMYGSGQWAVYDGYAALKWVKAGMRSNNLEANARLCMASRPPAARCGKSARFAIASRPTWSSRIPSTLDALDNLSYEPDYKKCAVQVRKG